VVGCQGDQLILFIYLLNSGLLHIKRFSSTNTLDSHDLKAVAFGMDLVKQLTQEYQRWEKERPHGNVKDKPL
jgi:hypothetical protein